MVVKHTDTFMQIRQGDYKMTISNERIGFWLCWGLTTRQPLWVILCRLPEKGRKETEEIVEEIKERNREESGTGIKVKKHTLWGNMEFTLQAQCMRFHSWHLNNPCKWILMPQNKNPAETAGDSQGTIQEEERGDGIDVQKTFFKNKCMLNFLL